MIDFKKKTYNGKKYKTMDVIVNGVEIFHIKDIIFIGQLIVLKSSKGNRFRILKNEPMTFHATFKNKDGEMISPKELNITGDIYRYMAVRQIAIEIVESFIIDHVEPNGDMIDMEIHDALYNFRLDIKERIIAILKEHKE